MTSTDADSARPGRRRPTATWLLPVVFLGLPLITPLLRWTSVPCTHDGHLHYHRVAAMAHAWHNGIHLTRWVPDLAFGYGYPFFVFREAAPLYAVLLPHLAGLPVPAASNLFYALTILAAGVFMALWARDVFGPRAAIVAAVAYMSAPYVLIDALVRGNAPESLALPLFPFLLWVGRRWVLFGSVRAFLAGALGLALLSVSHNISTFIFAPTLLVYLGALAVARLRPSRPGVREEERAPQESDSLPPDRRPVGRPSLIRHPMVRAALLILLGLGLAFFYTGGAVLEMEEVTLEMSTTTRNNDWRYNFASIGEILSPVTPEDPNLINPPLRLRLGWVPLLLAVLGASGLVWLRGDDARAREQRLHIWLMLGGAAVYLFMALPISRPLWDTLPLIDFVQFPWRFVGRAALPVALLAGAAFGRDRQPAASDQRRNEPTNDQWGAEGGPANERDRSQPEEHTGIPPSGVRRASARGRLTFARRLSPVAPILLAVLLLIAEAVPNLYPRYCPEEPFPTIMTVHAYERASGLVGVDPEGSYFPRTVRQRPTGSALEADFAAGRTPQRFDATALPPGATLSDVVYSCHGVTLRIDTPQAFTARYLSFDFPGWTARIDGAPTPITAEDPSGLITFDVPAGAHRVEVRWGATPLRVALVTLSVLSGAGVLAVVWVSGRSGRRRAQPAGASPLERDMVAALLGLAILLLAGKALLDRVETPLRRVGSPPVAVAGRVTGGELRLDGHNLSREGVAAGETFDIDMAWTTLAPPAVDYQSDVWLVGADGLIWSVKGTERPRIFEDAPPTRQWLPGQWAWDSREVRVLSGAPPGHYDIVLTLFDKATLQPVTLVDSVTGAAVGPTAVVGSIAVANSTAPPDFAPQYPLDAAVAPGLAILGFNQDRTEAAPGENVLLTLFWACEEPALCARFTIRLEDENGQSFQSWTRPVVAEGFLEEAWPVHGRLRGQYPLSLPAGLPGGSYRFVLAPNIPLGELRVNAPDRRFAAPALSLALDTSFSTLDGATVATLVGLAGGAAQSPCLATPSPGQPCALPLIWRAEAETPVGYHVFVHLVDESGRILAQSDAVPANWSRPTTGWLPGEYILDTHTLTLPSLPDGGSLTLRVGLYDPTGSGRLRAGADDFAAIPWP